MVVIKGSLYIHPCSTTKFTMCKLYTWSSVFPRGDLALLHGLETATTGNFSYTKQICLKLHPPINELAIKSSKNANLLKNGP